MTTPTTQFTAFGQKVRQVLAENKAAGRQPDSIRSLSRVIGQNDPVRSASAKRSLHKWFKEGDPNPTDDNKRIVAEALGVDSESLDDEEEDPVATLMAALRQVVRSELSRGVAA